MPSQQRARQQQGQRARRSSQGSPAPSGAVRVPAGTRQVRGSAFIAHGLSGQGPPDGRRSQRTLVTKPRDTFCNGGRACLGSVSIDRRLAQPVDGFGNIPECGKPGYSFRASMPLLSRDEFVNSPRFRTHCGNYVGFLDLLLEPSCPLIGLGHQTVRQSWSNFGQTASGEHRRAPPARTEGLDDGTIEKFDR